MIGKIALSDILLTMGLFATTGGVYLRFGIGWALIGLGGLLITGGVAMAPRRKG